MEWLKHLTVDLLATLVIILVVFFETALLEYVLYIYTGLMVLARFFSFFKIDIRDVTKQKMVDVPVWIHHVLYLLNVVILIIGHYYITSACWLFIWIAAAIVYYRKK